MTGRKEKKRGRDDSREKRKRAEVWIERLAWRLKRLIPCKLVNPCFLFISNEKNI